MTKHDSKNNDEPKPTVSPKSRPDRERSLGKVHEILSAKSMKSLRGPHRPRKIHRTTRPTDRDKAQNARMEQGPSAKSMRALKGLWSEGNPSMQARAPELEPPHQVFGAPPSPLLLRPESTSRSFTRKAKRLIESSKSSNVNAVRPRKVLEPHM